MTLYSVIPILHAQRQGHKEIKSFCHTDGKQWRDLNSGSLTVTSTHKQDNIPLHERAGAMAWRYRGGRGPGSTLVSRLYILRKVLNKHKIKYKSGNSDMVWSGSGAESQGSCT